MASFGHLSVQIWIRLFSSPDTPSQSYGSFAFRLLHLDTFLSRYGSSDFRTQSALARRPPIQMRVLCPQMRFRSTPADASACPMCSDALSLDGCRSTCVSCVLRCALARRLSVQMSFLRAQMRSRLALVDPNACPVCSDALSLDACRSKMCFLYAQMRSR